MFWSHASLIQLALFDLFSYLAHLECLDIFGYSWNKTMKKVKRNFVFNLNKLVPLSKGNYIATLKFCDFGG